MLITGAFARVLEAERSAFNYKFAEAKRLCPALDADAFSDHLRTAVAPIVAAVEPHWPDRVDEVARVLYDLSLDLLGQGLLGPNSRYPAITRGWLVLLPGLARHMAAAPRRAVGAITNALYNLSVTSGARAEEWCASMIELAALASNLDALLQAGQIAAWRAGMAHYRQGALDLCARLDPALARAALGLPPSNALSLETILSRLSADPWLKPEAVREPLGKKQLQIVARAGAFRGLGGLFLTTPTVATAGEHFIVREGEARWLLVADVFGATWHRLDGGPAVGAVSNRAAPFSLDDHGRVKLDRHSQTWPELARPTSAVSNGATLAVTTSLSFAVHLVALVET